MYQYLDYQVTFGIYTHSVVTTSINQFDIAHPRVCSLDLNMVSKVGYHGYRFYKKLDSQDIDMLANGCH